MEYYRHYDLPVIPEHLLAQVQFDHRPSFVLDYGRRYHRGSQLVYAPWYVVFPVESEELRQWLAQHVPPELNIQWMNQAQTRSTHPTQCEMIPHTDMVRSWTLNYYIDSGGDESELAWFQEQGYPIEREPRADGVFQQTPEGWADYDQLTEVASVRIENNSWYWIRTDILHGVKNVTGTRQFLCLW